MSPKNSMVGRCISYWNSPFLGDMLVFRGVCFFKSSSRQAKTHGDGGSKRRKKTCETFHRLASGAVRSSLGEPIWAIEKRAPGLCRVYKGVYYPSCMGSIISHSTKQPGFQWKVVFFFFGFFVAPLDATNIHIQIPDLEKEVHQMYVDCFNF